MASKKSIASKWLSRYIRVRDCIGDYIGVCCTCGRRDNIKHMDAGHFISRGKGGVSGVYFDERNVHIQCKGCNAWGGSQTLDRYKEFIIQKYGKDVLKELKLKDKTNTYKPKDFVGLTLFYQEETEKLLKEKNLKAWW